MPDATAQPVFSTAQYQKFALAAAVLALGFIIPLWKLLLFALGDDLHSYIPLMPLVSGYLVWTQKSQLPRASTPARKLAVLFGLAGLAAAAAFVALLFSSAPDGLETRLALSTLAWLLCLAGAGC